jgi:hypothetical protein
MTHLCLGSHPEPDVHIPDRLNFKVIEPLGEARMADQSAVAIYDSMAKAEQAVHELDVSEYPIQQVSIVSRNLEGGKAGSQVHHCR